MRAGQLRKVGMLQQRPTTRDSYGGTPAAWTDVAPVRYMIDATAAREMQSAGNVRAVATVTITMRYRSGVVPGMRIRSEATDFEPFRYWNITAVHDVNMKHYELELTASEDRTAIP